MKKIAVTGGAGFVGSNLVRRLLNLKYEVRIIDDFSTGMRRNISDLPCEVASVSIANFAELRDALNGCDYIFHLAARGSVPRSLLDPRATLEVNALGTLNVLECAREFGAHLAFTSSSSVYGSNEALPKTEKMWTNPISPYAASKLGCEALVSAYSYSFEIPSITYRFFNIFGPWQRPDHDYAAVIPKWIWSAMHGKTIEVFGDGTQSRDFTYVDDVIEVLIQGLEKKLNITGPLNLAYGNRVTLNELIVILENNFADLEIKYRQKRKGDVLQSQNDPSALFELFPTLKPVELERAMQTTIEWLKSAKATEFFRN